MSTNLEPNNAGPGVTAAELQYWQQLYDDGQFFKAYSAIEAFGPPESWRQTDAQIFAGRLMRHIGGHKRGDRLILRAWRHSGNDPRAWYYKIWVTLNFRGPIVAWRELQELKLTPESPAELRTDYFSLKTRLLTELRDFARADEALAEGEATGLDRAWLALERTHWLEAQDRYAEALAACERGLALHPTHWACSGSYAHLLVLLGKEAQAIAYLQDTTRRLESASLVAQLANLLMETGQPAQALAAWERYPALAPLMDDDTREWLAMRRSNAAYQCEDFETAARFAAEVKNNPLYQRFHEQLSVRDPSWRRVQLPVGFVRQHHLTCVPATLSTLSRFWQQSADHLEVAEAICYDGTSSDSERNWAEQNGWQAREFKIDWNSAKQLIDRGLPFTYTTVQPANAHEQAIIGYDDLRGSLLIRDPYYPQLIEVFAERELEQQAPNGPRGMAMVPQAQAGKLADLELPEANLYDQHHQVLRALARHQRAAAQTAAAELAARVPGHRLAIQARRAIAYYDENTLEILAAVDELLGLFPEDVNLQLTRLSCLGSLGRREERLTYLAGHCTGKNAHPLLWQEWARELEDDAREHQTALCYLKRARRLRMADADGLAIEANIIWSQGHYTEATEFYRIAACLNDTNERRAWSYFRAARFVRQTETALAFLRARCDKTGRRSSRPWRTVFDALRELDRNAEAFAVLNEVLALRPGDGELKLYAAEEFSTTGQLSRAEELLQAAQGIVPEMDWWRSAAQLAERKGENAEAIDLWQGILKVTPLAMDAHRAVSRLLEIVEGRVPALAHLQAAVERFPHYYPLLRLWLAWMREDGSEIAEPVIRRLVQAHPDDAWARREHALILADLRRYPEALAELSQAEQLEPRSASLFSVRGRIYRDQGQLEQARSDFREALRLSVDSDFAMRALVEACTTGDQRREALDFIKSELVRQVTFGDGLLNFAEVAAPYLAPEALLAVLREAHEARPDLWHAWSALTKQLLMVKSYDEALMLAQTATRRFPHLARLWLDLARVQRARSEVPAAINSIEQALQISPSWGYASRQLSSAYEAIGDLLSAVKVLERAMQHSPLDPYNHGWLAECLWKLDRHDEALNYARQSAIMEPDYGWVWNAVRDWSKERGQAEAAYELARELTHRRPGEERSWLLLARMLEDDALLDERLAALDKAITLNPRSIDAWDLRAAALYEAGRFDEALAACQPKEWGEHPPGELRARQAWLRAQRGELGAAIHQMKQVLAEHPGMDWAWRSLARWHYEREEWNEAAAAAEQLIRFDPLDAVPLGYAADLKLRAKDYTAAKELLRRALDLDPSYTYAGFHLFDLQLQDGDHEGAAATLRRMQNQALGPEILYAELQLAEHTKDKARALEIVKQLCTEPDDDAESYERAVELLHRCGWAKAAEKTIENQMAQPALNPSTGMLLVSLRAKRSQIDNKALLNRVKTRGLLGMRSFAAQLDALGDSVSGKGIQNWYSRQRCAWHLRRLLNKHCGYLKQDDWLWGKIGYVMRCVKWREPCVRWLSDWSKRKKIEPWMLYNYVTALHEKGQDREAHAVIRHVLSLPARESILPRFRLWAALEDILQGRQDEAENLLQGLDPIDLGESDRCGFDLLKSILDYAQPNANPPVFDQQREQAFKAFAAGIEDSKSQRRFFKRALDLVARRTGKTSLRLWGWWQLNSEMFSNISAVVIALIAIARWTHAFGGTA